MAGLFFTGKLAVRHFFFTFGDYFQYFKCAVGTCCVGNNNALARFVYKVGAGAVVKGADF